MLIFKKVLTVLYIYDRVTTIDMRHEVDITSFNEMFLCQERSEMDALLRWIIIK